jgi:hypothetical protein
MCNTAQEVKSACSWVCLWHFWAVRASGMRKHSYPLNIFQQNLHCECAFFITSLTHFKWWQRVCESNNAACRTVS